MTRHRTIIRAVGLLLALCLAAPVSAQANPILSGYGGPGQGNQTILGSALLNGPVGGGGGSAGGGSAGGGLSGENGSATTPTSGAATRAGHGGASKAHGQSGAPASSPETTAQAARDAASAYLAAERGHAVGQSGALGLGGQDLLYIILVLAALTLAAVFTRRLTQTTAAGTQR